MEAARHRDTYIYNKVGELAMAAVKRRSEKRKD